MKVLFLLCGALFGFLLSRAGVTDFHTMVGLFRFETFHVGGVMALAIAVTAAGLAFLGRSGKKAVIGCPIEIPRKPMRHGIAYAGIVFGAGWALTGTWPGTALAQLGELKTYALFTIAGILAGTWVYGWRAPRGPGA